jgi:hypothetical protein
LDLFFANLTSYFCRLLSENADLAMMPEKERVFRALWWVLEGWLEEFAICMVGLCAAKDDCVVKDIVHTYLSIKYNL